MNTLFIKVCLQGGKYFVDIKTFVVISIYKLVEKDKLRLNVSLTGLNKDCFIEVSFEDIDFEVLSEPPILSNLSVWPIILLSDNYIISGLCSVSRQICRLSDKEHVKKLLGFREACLVACAETSMWTKFCEIDIILMVNNILTFKGNVFHMPKDVLRYENHLSQPVRIHNIYKLARNNKNDQGIKSSVPRHELEVPHDYAEGPYVTLADLILYPCFTIIFQYFQYNTLSVKANLPLTIEWLNQIRQQYVLPKFHVHFSKLFNKTIIIPEVANVSLYKADPVHMVSAKHHTKQYKIESALNLIKPLEECIVNHFHPVGFNNNSFNWNAIPLSANPQGGALPASRADRKCEQLENLIKAALEVVGEKNYRIVDFCSGSGHMGILIALVLPQCQVILVENKERSLARARNTISQLKLTNVIVVQSNLDYFTGDFNLGMSLHACGLATDLVIQHCIKNKADFICCPCCYGGIRDCHEVSYPRSQSFKKCFLSKEDYYFNLAHAADQTHQQENIKTKQGYFCMDVIDSDRRLFAEECGYKIHLGKLQPVTCTNKNNLLVGQFVGTLE
ncbi:glutathione S-transferase C-terminal domain-containing protein homolog [Euwallacea similis]|uniref:glutathione S-transferase C-terminal domain-containing protein homolog n=1 Tax=Euwallacea similis TaxID=1736056 RepID=UPI00344F7B33